jgi:hypothetical protein
MNTNNPVNNIGPDPQNQNAQPAPAWANQNSFYNQAAQSQAPQVQTPIAQAPQMQPPQAQAPQEQIPPAQAAYAPSNPAHQATAYGYGTQPNQNPNYTSSTPAPPMGPQGYCQPAPYQKWNALCIVGFVLAFLAPIFGLVLSIVSLIQINRTGEKSKSMATAGIIVSAVSLTIRIALIVAIIAGMNAYLDGLKDGDIHQYCNGVGCDSYHKDHSDPNDDPDDEDTDPDDEDTDAKTNDTYYLYDWQQVFPASSLISVQ